MVFWLGDFFVYLRFSFENRVVKELCYFLINTDVLLAWNLLFFGNLFEMKMLKTVLQIGEKVLHRTHNNLFLMTNFNQKLQELFHIMDLFFFLFIFDQNIFILDDFGQNTKQIWNVLRKVFECLHVVSAENVIADLRKDGIAVPLCYLIVQRDILIFDFINA